MLRMHSTHHSAVTTGRIARFILTRLCCSQILSIQDLFQTPFSKISVWSLAIPSWSLCSIPCILLSGLSSISKGNRSGPSPQNISIIPCNYYGIKSVRGIFDIFCHIDTLNMEELYSKYILTNTVMF